MAFQNTYLSCGAGWQTVKRRFCALTLGILVSAMVVPVVASALPTAPVVPQVRVEVGPVAPVDVNRDTETIITTNGTVDITVPAWATIEMRVYFNVSVNRTFWPATISSMSAVLTGSGVVPFTVNVSVPGRAAVEAGAVIYVDANVSVPPGLGRSWGAETPIPIVQYFGLAITPSTSTSPSNFSAPSGTETVFSVRIQNLGNGGDSFELQVENLAELQASGISVFLPSPVTIAAKVTAIVNGNLSLPASLLEGNFTLSIRALSTGAAARGEAVSTEGAKRFTVTLPEEPDGGGTPSPQSGNGALPAFDAAATLAAAAGAAVLAVRRVRRP